MPRPSLGWHLAAPVSDEEPGVNGTADRLPGVPAAIVWLMAMFAIGLAAAYVFVANVAIPLNLVPAILTMPTSFGLVGALLATRHPHNPIGWIFWSASLIVLVAIAASSQSSTSTALSEWFGDAIFLPTIVAVVLFVPLLFPTGRLPSRSWRPLAAIMIFGLATLMLPNMFSPGLMPQSTFENPVAVPALGPLLEVLRAPSSVTMVICFAIAVVAPVWRYRRGGPVERQQLKWFAAATAVTIPALALAATHLPVVSELGWMVGLLALGLMPVAIALAILRYRLYEIDRIISRTVGWALVTGLLGAVFAGLVVGLQTLFATVTGGNTLAVAASTLVVAALFQPLRRRIQGAVDRRFNRARYDAQRTADGFAEQLRNEVDLARLRVALVDSVEEAVRPVSTTVWLRSGSEGR
jgi:hypothetical protein